MATPVTSPSMSNSTSPKCHSRGTSWRDARGERLMALPVFPLRMFMQPYIFCGNRTAISSPEALKGRRVGIQQYRITVGLWTRGILNERHGVHHTEIDWVTTEPEAPATAFPAASDWRSEMTTSKIFCCAVRPTP